MFHRNQNTAELIWVEIHPSYDEPMCDGENFFTTRHIGKGNLISRSGRVLLGNTELDTAAEQFLGVVINVRRLP